MRARGVTWAALLAVIGLVGLQAPNAGAAQSPSSFASRLLALVDQARSQQGLSAVRVASGTSDVAATWTQHLAAQQTLAHNPDLPHQLETHGSPNWTAYGENVGTGAQDDPDRLFRAYMQSSEHRANVLGPAYRWVGVGVVFSGGAAYNTLDFVDTYAGTTASTPAPAPVPAPHAARRPAAKPAAAPARTPAARPAPRPVHGSAARRAPRPRLRVLAARQVSAPRLTTPARRGPDADDVPFIAAPAATSGAVALRGGSLHERLPVALAALLVTFVASSWLQEVRRKP